VKQNQNQNHHQNLRQASNPLKGLRESRSSNGGRRVGDRALAWAGCARAKPNASAAQHAREALKAARNAEAARASVQRTKVTGKHNAITTVVTVGLVAWCGSGIAHADNNHE
jgi:hypothetical protein